MSLEIFTSDEQSFAQYTLHHRIPKIIDGLIDINPSYAHELIKLRNSIPNESIKHLKAENTYHEDINNTISSHNYHWNNAPFLFIENYLYHKLSETMNFRNNRFDYFRHIKLGDLQKKSDKLVGLWQQVEQICKLNIDESAQAILKLNLLGNMADLSQDKVTYNSQANNTLLIDHSKECTRLLKSSTRMDIILDNAGEELFLDLCLAYWILKKTSTKTVQLHFKSIPYFVSDALITDFNDLLCFIADQKGLESLARFLSKNIAMENILYSDDEFWSSGLLYSQMPTPLKSLLEPSELLIFKGDLNYRKLVGDRYWEHTTPTKNIVNYLGMNAVFIRVLKSEVLVGMDKNKIQETEDRSWLYNGRYGIIDWV
ncbi:damage-control phosphatase ARMT1 family protein [Saccharicrinis sp. GN24d3]|uniref:damage-control phosphatase ARMT1 family protein n=1 Tax=Saccharicrinis sp. GN24d3 TaxID=3458416 RepID=UPI0040363056